MNNQKEQYGVVLFIVAIVQFLNPFMASGVGIALPTIGKSFNAGAVQLGMVEMTYLLSVLILLLPAGRFADIFGRKKVFISGISLFTFSTLILAFTPNIITFIVVRFFQGVGAAFITSTSVAILTSVFKGKGRGRAMGIATASVYLGISLGPTIAGVIITHFGWRWIFIIPFIFQVSALILTVTKLKGEWADSVGETFDIKGSVVFSLTLFALIFGVLEINKNQFALPLLLSGLAGIIVFYLVEKRTQYPLLDFKLITHNRIFTFSNIATLINYSSSFGITFILSFYLQSVRKLSPQSAGLILMSQPLMQVLFSFVSGRLSDEINPGKIATVGMSLCAIGIFTMSFVTSNTEIYKIILILLFIGFGFGIFSPSNMAVIMGSVKPREYGVASSILATMRSMGMLSSMTIVTVALSYFIGHNVSAENNILGYMQMFGLIFRLFAVLSVIGVFLSLGRIREKTSL